ncbi:SPOR domain-containing protein [uncultured Arthrobacter sp.]|uniref:SPOR domain-containing protein n=1 Tax=uncultured Arthrobacter sp. TaxID=114050 RepID=UPI002624A5DE|nr:SPOR domain-containing protein [uncultured Arthrobacter sp.]
MTEYWFNVRTREVEEDRQSDWKQLIGPYATRSEAENALQKVKERNEAWESDDDWGRASGPATG